MTDQAKARELIKRQLMRSDEGVANVLKTMMGDDIIVDETGRIDVEACDKRQDFESTATAIAAHRPSRVSRAERR